MAVELSPLFFCLRNSSSILHFLAAFPLPAAALRGSAPSRWRCRLESKLDSRAQAKARRFQAPAAGGADTVRVRTPVPSLRVCGVPPGSALRARVRGGCHTRRSRLTPSRAAAVSSLFLSGWGDPLST